MTRNRIQTARSLAWLGGGSLLASAAVVKGGAQ